MESLRCEWEDTKVLQRKPQGEKHAHKKIVTTNLVRHLNHLHPVEYGHVKEANTGQVSCLYISKAVMRKIIEITGKAKMGVCPDKIDFCLYKSELAKICISWKKL